MSELNRFSTKTSAYTVVANDHGTTIVCTTNPVTLTLTAVASLPIGFSCTIIAKSAVTIDPNASETIDGATTLVVAANEAVTITSTGNEWLSSARKGGGGGASGFEQTFLLMGT